ISPPPSSTPTYPIDAVASCISERIHTRDGVDQMTLDPHTAIMLVLVSGVGYAMAYAGIAKNALEWKRRRRVCPSCGRHDASCSCG
ncbi:MAG TPA: hypothetical protein VIU16_00585, partial [Gaiellaceae bacterium]